MAAEVAVEMMAETIVGIRRKELRWALAWACVVVAVTCLPYLYAWLAAPEGLVFGGLLTNPLDGNSYLAKMRQGFRGEWRFHLPFTPEPHDGAYVYLHYLALGHLARMLGISLPLTYHLARVFTGFLLFLTTYWFIGHLVQENDVALKRTSVLLVALSSGLGWLAATLDLFTADLWVPEAITFYAILANPHFPLSMTLMLVIIGLATTEDCWQDQKRRRQAFGGLVFSSFLLAVVQPFAALPVYVALGGYAILLAIQNRRLAWNLVKRATIGGMATLPPILYASSVFYFNPAFVAWSAQNLTYSPPLWNVALSYGLVIFFAVPGIAIAIRRRSAGGQLFVAWVTTTVGLMYVPLTLQRRMITGLHFPLCFLAAGGLRWLVSRWPARQRLLTHAIVGLSTLTNLFLLLGAVVAVRSGDPRLFLYRDEVTALAWLRDHAATDALVLAAPETGLLIPAWAGQRVVYGHPFETVQAEERESLVREFFASPARAEQILASFDVDYVFWGPRERSLGDWVEGAGWPPAYQNEAVTIFALH